MPSRLAHRTTAPDYRSGNKITGRQRSARARGILHEDQASIVVICSNGDRRQSQLSVVSLPRNHSGRKTPATSTSCWGFVLGVICRPNEINGLARRFKSLLAL